MNIISVTEYKVDEPIALLKRQEKLDPKFAEEVRKLNAWQKISDDDLLDAQTFVAWVRLEVWYKDKSIQECLENDSYSWSEPMEVEEV